MLNSVNGSLSADVELLRTSHSSVSWEIFVIRLKIEVYTYFKSPPYNQSIFQKVAAVLVFLVTCMNFRLWSRKDSITTSNNFFEEGESPLSRFLLAFVRSNCSNISPQICIYGSSCGDQGSSISLSIYLVTIAI